MPIDNFSYIIVNSLLKTAAMKEYERIVNFFKEDGSFGRNIHNFM